MADRYRPGSGTEGMDFMQNWCARCKCDQAFRDDEGDSCPIAAATFGGPVEEWQYERGEPVCTAFEAVDPLDVPHMRSAAVRDLFPGPRRPTQGEQIRMLVMGSAGRG